MGKVAVEVKVMSNSPELNLDSLEDAFEDPLPEGAKIKDSECDDVAFGLVALLPTVIVPDSVGGTEVVEEAFIEVEGVESVPTENVGRI